MDTRRMAKNMKLKGLSNEQMNDLVPHGIILLGYSRGVAL